MPGPAYLCILPCQACTTLQLLSPSPHFLSLFVQGNVLQDIFHIIQGKGSDYTSIPSHSRPSFRPYRMDVREGHTIEVGRQSDRPRQGSSEAVFSLCGSEREREREETDASAPLHPPTHPLCSGRLIFWDCVPDATAQSYRYRDEGEKSKE